MSSKAAKTGKRPIVSTFLLLAGAAVVTGSLFIPFMKGKMVSGFPPALHTADMYLLTGSKMTTYGIFSRPSSESFEPLIIQIPPLAIIPISAFLSWYVGFSYLVGARGRGRSILLLTCAVLCLIVIVPVVVFNPSAQEEGCSFPGAIVCFIGTLMLLSGSIAGIVEAKKVTGALAKEAMLSRGRLSDRFRELDSLKKKNLLTEKEYQRKRRELLDEA